MLLDGMHALIRLQVTSMNRELAITPDSEYLDTQYTDGCGQEHDRSFSTWDSSVWWHNFIEGLTRIFETGLFEEGRSDANSIYINLSEVSAGYGIDLENIFPKDKYKH